MSSVEFDEDSFGSSRPAPSQPTTGGMPPPQQSYGRPMPPSNIPKMSAWLMKKGLVKSPHSAQIILLIVVVLNIIISILVYHFFV